MDYSIIKTELQQAAYTGLSDASAAALLNAETISVKQAISTQSIKQYLLLVDSWVSVKTSTELAAVVAVDALNMFDELDMSNPLIENKVSQMMDGLIAASLITEVDKTTILAMGDTLISRAKELGVGVVKPANVQFSRSL